jgi:hypothetical protein
MSSFPGKYVVQIYYKLFLGGFSFSILCYYSYPFGYKFLIGFIVIVRSLYFKNLSVSYLVTLILPEIAISIKRQVPLSL